MVSRVWGMTSECHHDCYNVWYGVVWLRRLLTSSAKPSISFCSASLSPVPICMYPLLLLLCLLLTTNIRTAARKTNTFQPTVKRVDQRNPTASYSEPESEIQMKHPQNLRLAYLQRSVLQKLPKQMLRSRGLR